VWQDDGKLDVSAAYATCALAYPDMFGGPAAGALVWFLSRSGGFAVEDVPSGRGLPEPSMS
jgi:hypothetical protein